MSVNVYDFAWQYLDRPRSERWVALQDAREQGLSFDPDVLIEALGLDCEAFAQLFSDLPPEERRAAAKAEMKRLGLHFSPPALLDALSGRRW